MKIKTKNLKGVPIFGLRGSLSTGTDIKALRETVLSVKSKQIVINVSGLDKMDSSGLGELVALSKDLATRGVDSLFVAIPTQLSLLKTTKLKIFGSESEAITIEDDIHF